MDLAGVFDELFVLFAPDFALALLADLAGALVVVFEDVFAGVFDVDLGADLVVVGL